MVLFAVTLLANEQFIHSLEIDSEKEKQGYSLISTTSDQIAPQLRNEEQQIPCSDNDINKAEDTLINFFNYLHDGKYDKAVSLFEPWEEGIGMHKSSWEGILSFSPQNKRNGEGKAIGLRKIYQSVGVPIKVKILGVEKVADGNYKLRVNFIKDDGEIYIYGPCCGATEKKMPSQSEFDYFVQRVNGVYKVRTPPLFRP